MNISLLELNNYGLSISICNKYVDIIDLISLNFIPNLSFMSKLDVTFSTINKIRESYCMLMDKNDEFRIFMHKLGNLFNTKNIFSDNEIDIFINENIDLKDNHNFQCIKVSLIKNEILILNNGIYQVNIFDASSLEFESYFTYLENSLSRDDFIITNNRFGLEDGIPKSLEFIGNKLNLTRERIRQKERTILNLLWMDCFDDITNFNINEIKSDSNLLTILKLSLKFELTFKTFNSYFGRNINEFNLIKMFIEVIGIRIKKILHNSEIELIKLIQDDVLIKTIMDNNKLFIKNDGEVEKQKTLSLIIESFKYKKEQSSDEILQFIMQHSDIKINVRTIENICSGFLPFISNGGYIYKILNLKEDLSFYSDYVLKFFVNKKGLFNCKYFIQKDLNEFCNLIGIETSNELHNFIKKIFSTSDQKFIKFERMPFILLNYENKYDFYIELIKSYEKISSLEFHRQLNNEYGLDMVYLNANLPKTLEEFYANGVYRFVVPVVTDAIILEKINNILNNMSIIKKSDFNKFLNENNIQVDSINNKTLNKLGYRAENNYVIKSNLTIKKFILNTIEIKGSYERGMLQYYGIDDYTYLNNLLKSNKIFRLSPVKYVFFQSMVRDFFNSEILNNFISDVYIFLQKNIFSNFENILLNFKEKYKFINIFEEEWIFYLISNSEKIFLCSKKNRIYTYHGSIDFYDYLSNFIKNHDKIHLEDVSNFIVNKFYFKIDYSEIVEKITRIKSELYFDNFKNTFYRKKEIFISEVFND